MLLSVRISEAALTMFFRDAATSAQSRVCRAMAKGDGPQHAPRHRTTHSACQQHSKKAARFFARASM